MRPERVVDGAVSMFSGSVRRLRNGVVGDAERLLLGCARDSRSELWYARAGHIVWVGVMVVLSSWLSRAMMSCKMAFQLRVRVASLLSVVWFNWWWLGRMYEGIWMLRCCRG